MDDKFTRIVYLFFLLAILIGGSAIMWGYGNFMQPGPLRAETNVIIERGSGFGDIAQKLADAGVVSNSMVFRFGAQFLGVGKALRAGEYAFTTGISPQGALEIMQSGRTVIRRITFAEGLTTTQILNQLNAAEGLVGDAVDADQEQEALKEGVFLPETYHFSYGDSRAKFVQRMVGAMSQKVSAIWNSRAFGLPINTPEEAVILASIIEKETGRPEERAHIAGVFINRLKKGMRLQSDPTVTYGLTLGKAPLGRPLSRADLKNPTPYNTYVINGLPPTPISNPGKEALAAVVRPQKTEDLYFVADGTGGHVFARTLQEHNKNVANWRKISKKKKQKTGQ